MKAVTLWQRQEGISALDAPNPEARGVQLGSQLAWSRGRWVFTPTETFGVQSRLGCVKMAEFLGFDNDTV